MAAPNSEPPSSFKHTGNAYFAAGQYAEAIEAYTRGIEQEPEASALSVLYGNRALALLKLGGDKAFCSRNAAQAEADATRSVELDPTYKKGYFQRATARESLGNSNGAIADYEKILELDPGNVDTKIALARLTVERESKACLPLSTPIAPRTRGNRRFTIGSLEKATDEEYWGLMETVPRTAYPQTLADFGYHFNEEGRLRNIRTGAKFAWLGQKHYDALGDIVYREIQSMMVSQFDMVERWLPLQSDGSDAPPGTPRVNIFHSKDLATCERLMVLCQGIGAVRAGQWARALCINDSLHNGAVLDYLVDARKRLGCSIIVLNPNMNSVSRESLNRNPPAPVDDTDAFWLGTPDKEWKVVQNRISKTDVDIPRLGDQVSHTVYCWDTFVAHAAAKDVVIVAHSYGGCCTMGLVRQRFPEVERRVCAVAFTDAVHDIKPSDEKEHVKFMQRVSVNWLGSKLPLDTPLPSRDGCKRVSAGHETHEFTSGSAQSSVFAFLESSLRK